MGNLKTKNLVEFDYVSSFYYRLKLKPNNLNQETIDRYITFNNVLNILFDNGQIEAILTIKDKLKKKEDPTTIFYEMLSDSVSFLFTDYHEIIEFYFDTDLMFRFK